MKSLIFVAVFVCFTALAAARTRKRRPEPDTEVNRSKRSGCFTADNSLTIEESTGLQDQHNKLRGQVVPSASNMAQLTWDEDLAAMAQWSANQCVFGHNNLITCESIEVGQNAFVATGKVELSEAVDDWYEEVKDFDYNSNSCKQNETCGHYTQVVWAATTNVGCAYRKCPTAYVDGQMWANATLVFCNYLTQGNIGSDKPYKSGPTCSQCETSNGVHCSENLCVNCIPQDDSYTPCNCNRTCESGGSLDAGKCTCKCPSPYFGSTCALSCVDQYPASCQNDWKSYCDDDAYYSIMLQYCPKTCNFC